MNQQCPEPTHSSNPQDPNFPDELTPIASYMVQQMRTNIMGDAVHAMQRLNTLSGRLHKGLMEWDLLERGLRWLGITQTSLKNETLVIGHTAFGLAHPKAIAWGIWTYMVAQNSSWDHKPVIGACFTPRSSTVQNYHAWGDRRYFYDIWSNIHYGYVGQTAGFMEWELLDGAGLEQIGTDALNGKMPRRSGSLAGSLRDFDNANDRECIKLGMWLRRKYLTAVSAQLLVQSIVNNPKIEFKPPGFKP